MVRVDEIRPEVCRKVGLYPCFFTGIGKQHRFSFTGFVSLLLSRNMVSEASPQMISTGVMRFVKHVTHYLEEHYREDIGLSGIAAEFGYSRDHFCRLFRKCYGMTFHKYLNFCRITLAKDILRKENHPDITSASSMLGYNNTTCFSRIFRRLAGMPPGAYSAAESEKRI